MHDATLQLYGQNASGWARRKPSVGSDQPANSPLPIAQSSPCGEQANLARRSSSNAQHKLDVDCCGGPKRQLDAALKTLHRHDEALRRRLIDAYENGDLSYVAVLLDARSFGDFVERWNDIRFVIKANQVTIRARKADADRVSRDPSRPARRRGQPANAPRRRRSQQKRRALDGLAQQRKNLLGVAERAAAARCAEVAQLEADISIRRRGARSSRWCREKQHEEELRARRSPPRRACWPASRSRPSRVRRDTPLWPASGPITSPFGMRIHPVSTAGRSCTPGSTSRVAQGTTIAAAAAGRIIVASYQGDCGNMIAIDHHGGLSTMYCHLSQIFVGVGQEVERGQAIGAVGMTGDATGPHLHFQVMQDGHPVDPMNAFLAVAGQHKRLRTRLINLAGTPPVANGIQDSGNFGRMPGGAGALDSRGPYVNP